MHVLISRLLSAGLFAALFAAGLATALPDGSDILIRDGTIVATAADYEMDGTMWTAFTRLQDSSTYLYRSTDHGLSWQQRLVSRGAGRIFDKLGLVVGEGESAFVYVFYLEPWQNGDLWLNRLDPRTDSVLTVEVAGGSDTIVDFAVCRDYSGSNYWLYAVATSHATPSSPAAAADGRALRFFRSPDYGHTWAVTDSYDYPIFDPHLSAGAGSYLYFVGFSPAWLGSIEVWVNRLWLSPGYWKTASWMTDTQNVHDPVIGAAFTKPESTATIWCAYSQNYENSGDWDVVYSYSTDGGGGWSSPAYLASSTGADEEYPDLRNYTSLGNPYVNVSYISDDGFRSVYRRYANASTPGQWSDTLRINQGSAGTGSEVRPKLCYTPGGPFSGAGAVFTGAGLNSCWWNGPYPVDVAESPDGISRRVLIQPSTGRGPFHIKAASMTAVAVHDRVGRLVRSLASDRSGTASWDGRGETGRLVASGIYFVRLAAGDCRATEKIVLQR